MHRIRLDQTPSSRNRTACRDRPHRSRDHVAVGFDHTPREASAWPHTGRNAVAGSVHPDGGGDLAGAFGVPVDLLIPGLDTRQGLKSVQGNSSAYRRLLVLFVDVHGEDLSRLRARLADPDLGEARRLAHSLKGAAATLGAMGLREAAEQLEWGLAGRLPEACIPDLSDRLDRAMEPLIAAIRARAIAAGTAAAATAAAASSAQAPATAAATGSPSARHRRRRRRSCSCRRRS